MFGSKAFKKALIGSTALIGVGVLAPEAALAVTACPSIISDASLAAAVCLLTTSSSVTVASAGDVGGISVTGSTGNFILNGGTIEGTTSASAGIALFSSSLTGGINNTGTIDTATAGIIIDSSSTIVGGITNSGQIVGESRTAIQIKNASTIVGGLSNEGTIATHGPNNVGIFLRDSLLSGDLNNSGLIEADNSGNGMNISGSSTIVGAILNSGTISGGAEGFVVLSGNISGGIENSGTVTGGTGTGIRLSNATTLGDDVVNVAGATISGATSGLQVSGVTSVSGDIVNQTGARISGGDIGIDISSAANISGSISNQAGAVISGGDTGIWIFSTANISGGIQNSGTITGDTYAIHISGLASVGDIDLFDGGIIDGAIDASGTDLNIHGGEISGTLNVNTLNIDGDFTTQGSITAQNIVTVGSGATLFLRNTVTSTGGIAGTGGTLAIVVDDGAVPALDSTLDLTNLNLLVDVRNAPLLQAGDAVMSAGSITGGPGGLIDDNSYLWNFQINGGATAIVALQASAGSLGFSQADNSTYDALQTIADNGTTDPVMLNILGNMNAADSQEALHDVLQSVEPTLDGSDLVGALTVSNQTLDLAGQQLAMLRGGGETGMAAGDGMQGVRAWGQMFGSRANQSEHGGVEGYNADTWGGALGIDTQDINDKAVLGVAFSYGNTNANSKNSNQTGTDVDSYQLTLYGDYDLGQDTFVNVMLAYGRQSVDTTRFNVGGIGGLNAHGSFNTNQYAARAELGRNYAYGSALVTPTILANYLHYAPESYTETGAGGANEHIARKDMDVFELGAGVNLSQTYKVDNGAFTPSVHSGYRYDLIGDHLESANTFSAGGPAFDTKGIQPGRGTFSAGMNLKYQTAQNWEFTAKYEFQYKSNYTNNAAFLRAAYKF